MAKKVQAKIVAAQKDAAKQLNDLFIDSLKYIYWDENALVKALPKMILEKKRSLRGISLV